MQIKRTPENFEYQQILDELLRHYMVLAERAVKNWDSIKDIQVPDEDKFQYACLGLVDAINEYDPSIRKYFIHFAARYMQNRIMSGTKKEYGVLSPRYGSSESIGNESELSKKFGRIGIPFRIAVQLIRTMGEEKAREFLEEIRTQDSR